MTDSQNNNTNPTVKIVALKQPLTGFEALFKQLELLGRNVSERPHTVIKFNNKIIYGSFLVERSCASGEKYLDLEVLELIRQTQKDLETQKEEPVFHSAPNDTCKVFKFADPNQIHSNGFEFLETSAKAGNEVFLIPNYIPLNRNKDNGIGANFVSEYSVFFLEGDDRSLPEQWERINWFANLTGLIPLFIVFSGGKSLHVHFGLETPLRDKETWQRIQRKLILIFHSDFQIQNPNREMRLAGVSRAAKNTIQSLEYYSNYRYTAAEFEEKLDAIGWFPHGLSQERWLKASRDYYRTKNDTRSPSEKEAALIEILKLPFAELFPKPIPTSSFNIPPIEGIVPIPLEVCLSKANRAHLGGVVNGSRNKTGYDLACDLIACEQYLISQRIAYTGNAEDLFDQYCRACDPTDWSHREWQNIWRSANSGARLPAANWQDSDALANKIHSWLISNDLGYKARVIYKWKIAQGLIKQPLIENGDEISALETSRSVEMKAKERENNCNNQNNNNFKDLCSDSNNSSHECPPKDRAPALNMNDNRDKKDSVDGTNSSKRPRARRNKWKVPTPFNGELGYCSQTNSTVVDPETGEPTTEKVKVFEPKTNFDFEITKELSSSSGGAIEILVKRSTDDKQYRAIVPSMEKLQVDSFITCLEQNLKTIVICNLSKSELGNLIAEKLHQYREGGGKLYKLAERIGCQPDGIRVFGDKHFDSNGNEISAEQSGYIYDPNLGKRDRLSHPTLAPNNPQALPNLIQVMEKFHGPEQILGAIFVLGWGTSTLHFEEIQRLEKRFPILNLFGEAGGGKTTQVSNALSLAGWQNESGSFSKISESALYENLQLCGSMPLLFDDPEKKIEFDELTKRLFNRKPRIVRENCQTPNTSIAITTNHIIGDGNPAVSSRMVHMPVPVINSGDPTYWPQLLEAREAASGAIGELIGIGYDPEAIKTLEQQLFPYLPKSHTRVAWNIALFTWYGMQVASLGGFDPERIKQYAIKVLCKTANNMDSKSSSLAKFLEGIAGLKAQSLVGEWDVRVIETKKHGSMLAISMASVWSMYEKVIIPHSVRKSLRI